VILRNPSLLALLAAELVSRVGSQMTFLALPWFVLVTTHSPTRMGVVLAVELLPTALLGVPSGTVVSRFGARLTMLGSDLMRVPLMASIPLLHAAGLLTFPLLLVLVAAFGCFNAPYFASQRVILPELLGNDQQVISQANSVLEGATQTSSLLGPPLAGVLIALLGAANVLYVDAATFAFSFVTVLLFVPRRERVDTPEESGGLLAGMSFLLRDALMGPLAGVIILLNAFGQMLGASLPVLAGRFSLSMLSSGQQRFDRGKLDYLSRRQLERLDPLDLASRVGRVLELRGVGFHPAQLTALAEGLRGAHTLSEAADEAEQILKRRPAPTDVDDDVRAVLGLFCELRSGWHEPYLAPSEAEELLAEVSEAAKEIGVARGTVLHSLRHALTGAERGVGMPYVVAAVERSDALVRCGCEDGP
jgi:hypothetical protein